jgi:hypothetical protein
MKLGVIAGPATQSNPDEERDLVSIVDLGDGIDAGEESGRSHQGERPDAAEERSGAQADRRFLTVDRHLAESRIDGELRDQRSDPAVRQARHQRDAALRCRIGNMGRNGAAIGHELRLDSLKSKSDIAQ